VAGLAVRATAQIDQPRGAADLKKAAAPSERDGALQPLG